MRGEGTRMIDFIRTHSQFVLLILIWIATSAFAPPLLYLVLPVSVFLMRRSELWPDMLFGFIICLVFSDMRTAMGAMKTAKYTYIIALSAIFLMDRARMMPLSRVFGIFLPFFVYALFPIMASPAPVLSLEKTLSYALLYLVVPNYVLFNFRRYGWDFFKQLTLFLTLILVTQWLIPLFAPAGWSYVEDRFRGYFGNPNGLAIFCYLVFLLFAVVNHLRPALFSRVAKVAIYLVIIYFLIACGSRTSLMATIMFVLFIRFFRISPFLGLLAFAGFIGLFETLSNNLPAIITSLGLQDYMRVDTIEDGSGRYIAWHFAWQQVNSGGFFLFGGGFVNDEVIMQRNFRLLSSLGHQGGVHNTYLTLWLNVGIVGLLIFFRSLFLLFIKAWKRTPLAPAILFSVLFSILYESWLASSLNPYTILLLIILTMISEEEIVTGREEVAPAGEGGAAPVAAHLVLPAR
jgi:O-antigen ligase